MYYELIRNCSHLSEIYTYFIQKNKESYFLKSSSSYEGIKNISNEYKGWKWYCLKNKDLKNQPAKYEILEENYVRLKIKFFKGEKIQIKKGITKNREYLSRVIKHYKEIWPFENDNVPMHGDLSLENILFSKNKIYFIDWEHFSINSSYWGFDIYYLLFETLWFSWNKRKKYLDNEIETIANLIKLLNHGLNDLNFNEYYKLSYLINFIEKNRSLWASQLSNNNDKLPLLNFKNKDVEYIDKLIYFYLRS